MVKNKAYIFGGETASGELATNELHAVKAEIGDEGGSDYTIFPAVSEPDGGDVPSARKSHAACAAGEGIAVFGGTDASGQILEEGSCIWLFNTAKSGWQKLEAGKSDSVPKSRSHASLFEHKTTMVLYGGRDSTGTPLQDVWSFNPTEMKWSQLPDAPVSSPNASLSDGVLYVISGTDNVSGDMHFLPLHTASGEAHSWNTVSFPANPLTPGPAARAGAGLIPVSTGYGRQYLLYLFGAQPDTASSAIEPVQPSSDEKATNAPPQYWSDMWTFQLPSSTPEVKPTTNISEALKPAKIKDAIRNALGVDSGKHSWAEVEVLPPADLDETAGKVHPGPRSSFACDVMKDGHTVVIWGGTNPKGEREGDGWIIKLS